MPKCKKCPAEIRFFRTSGGGWMPVDAEPNPEGSLVIVSEFVDTDDHGTTRKIPVVDLPGLFTPADADRWMPHWATCPEADEFRGSK